MAISFIELMRTQPKGEAVTVPAGGAVVFDTVVSNQGTQIGYGAGVITFNEAGHYYIDWVVAPQGGLTTNGSNWAIVTDIGGLTLIGSSHAKVSVTTGFAIVDAAAGETARLVNVSDGPIDLSQAVESKAGLVAYGIPAPTVVI